MTPGLQLADLRVAFGENQVVHGASFSVAPGEVMGLVGESGSGKSVTLRAITRLLPPSARIAGRAAWAGRDLAAMPAADLRRVRGRQVAMVFQEPGLALNPVMTIGAQIEESLAAHSPYLGRRARRDRAEALLAQVGIPSPRARLGSYPHEFSGGMRQRALIAVALAPGPHLLLADEPTTALDVTVQDGILRMLQSLVAESGMAMVLVTHDLGVVAETCSRIAVMYAGRVVEAGPARAIFHQPRHAYTAALLAAVPGEHAGTMLASIPGAPPDPRAMPPGCAFAPRCAHAMPACTEALPPMRTVGPGHESACLAADQLPPRA